MRRNILVAFLLILGFFETQAALPSCEGVGEDEIVLFPNPSNCSTFYECVYEEPVELSCPAGLHWNDRAKQCDFPDIAKCVEEASVKIYNSCEGVPDNVNVLLPNPADCESFIQCVHGQPMVRPCPAGLHWSVSANRCEWPEIANCRRNSCAGVPETEDVLLPNPENCGTYIQCVHQQPVVRPCPPGLHWSVQANRCEWPSIAGCSIPILRAIQHDIRANFICAGVPSTTEVFLPNPKDCASYIQCVKGLPEVKYCPTGLYWSTHDDRCVLHKNQNCTRNPCEDVPDNQNVLLPNPEECGSYIQCVNQEPVVRLCPPGLHWSAQANRCEWPITAGCDNTVVFVSPQNYTNCSQVPEDDIVLLPNPRNCSTFIQCDHQEPTIMPCPTGLHWNAAIRQCDYPQNAQCRQNVTSRSINRCAGVPDNENVLLPNPTDCGSFIQCVHGQPMVRPCPAGLHWSVSANRCEWPEIANCRRNSCEGVPETEDVLLPNPDDCGTYIQCVHQQPVVRPCPAGLHWSVQANRCEWPITAGCENVAVFVPSQNYTNCSQVPEDEIVLLPNPRNCSTFIQCVHQEPTIMPCPTGLNWNAAIRQCDYPQNAQCRQNVTSRSSNRCAGVPDNENVLLPNPADCGSFIQCVHGQPMVRPCPAGLHWSVSANRCEWPEIANCRRNSCEGVPETEDVLLPNPDDCGSYIQCVHQQPVVRPCPGGLHWSIQANRCEWPNIAGCSIPILRGIHYDIAKYRKLSTN